MNAMFSLRLIAVSFLLSVMPLDVGSDSLHAQTPPSPTRGLPALNLGGWTDEVAYQGWHIQRHAVIGHYRLTDPQGRRQKFGSWETCLAALEKTKKELPIPPLPKKIVLVTHGLGATSYHMQGLADYLTERGGMHVENIGYASTLEDIPAYARSLDNVIRHLEGVEEIDIVAHSMGNIVFRRYLGDLARMDESQRPKVKFGRMVMISPPNHGADVVDLIAEKTGDLEMVRMATELVAGESSKQLAPHRGWPELEKTLVIPNFEFGILAGGQGNEIGYFSQLPGDDDGLLTVETMKLDGANDYIQVKGLHQLMPTYAEVRKQTMSFLITGKFRMLDQAPPIK